MFPFKPRLGLRECWLERAQHLKERLSELRDQFGGNIKEARDPHKCQSSRANRPRQEIF